MVGAGGATVYWFQFYVGVHLLIKQCICKAGIKPCHITSFSCTFWRFLLKQDDQLFLSKAKKLYRVTLLNGLSIPVSLASFSPCNPVARLVKSERMCHLFTQVRLRKFNFSASSTHIQFQTKPYHHVWFSSWAHLVESTASVVETFDIVLHHLWYSHVVS